MAKDDVNVLAEIKYGFIATGGQYAIIIWNYLTGSYIQTLTSEDYFRR